MSQVRLKRHALREIKRHKQLFNETLREPNPVVTLLIADDGGVLAVGMNRERLSKHAAEKGWLSYEMKDFGVVL